eukprot:CAMPEP_0196576710 /NCGR_PEP_ID=MMETSP1081-20130531/5910_1 /TAXON_ID=36882 /ORGANISM="Pyramimonas amylifera, Strain CCMP720" /LENGTH=61 /DNA_ID=CAMNT_0041895393 /DNA_START=301 /DNA_END=482 /DNA_ORIENTATION=-
MMVRKPEEVGNSPVEDDREVIVGRKKKHVALWVGFIGEGYFGSQVNRNVDQPTVEARLEEA